MLQLVARMRQTDPHRTVLEAAGFPLALDPSPLALREPVLGLALELERELERELEQELERVLALARVLAVAVLVVLVAVWMLEPQSVWVVYPMAGWSVVVVVLEELEEPEAHHFQAHHRHRVDP